MSKKLGTLMDVTGPTRKRGVCYGATETFMPMCQTETAACIKGQHTFNNPLPSAPFGTGVHNNCDRSDGENMLLYNSFLWQSPKNDMQATKIDFRNNRETI